MTGRERGCCHSTDVTAPLIGDGKRPSSFRGGEVQSEASAVGQTAGHFAA